MPHCLSPHWPAVRLEPTSAKKESLWGWVGNLCPLSCFPPTSIPTRSLCWGCGKMVPDLWIHRCGVVMCSQYSRIGVKKGGPYGYLSSREKSLAYYVRPMIFFFKLWSLKWVRMKGERWVGIKEGGELQQEAQSNTISQNCSIHLIWKTCP